MAIDLKSSDNWHYEFLQKDNKYYVKRNDRDAVFVLSENDYKRLAAVSMSELTVAEVQKPILCFK